jgi:hypothetical protein
MGSRHPSSSAHTQPRALEASRASPGPSQARVCGTCGVVSGPRARVACGCSSPAHVHSWVLAMAELGY